MTLQRKTLCDHVRDDNLTYTVNRNVPRHTESVFGYFYYIIESDRQKQTLSVKMLMMRSC